MRITKSFIFGIIFIFQSGSAFSQCIITLQPDPNEGKDALLFDLSCSSSYAVSTGACVTTNFGTAVQNTISSWTWWGAPGNQRSIIEFNLSMVPPGCTVSNATLYLPHDGYTSDYNCGSTSTLNTCNDNSMGVYRVTQSWDEMSVTWANQPTYASSVMGADYVLGLDESDPYDTYSLNLTDMVNGWLTGTLPNYGIMLKHIVENSQYKRMGFGSSDHPDSTKRPYLVLELNCVSNCTNIIKGDIFHDYDGSCSKDGQDYGLAGWMIRVTPGPMYAITDINGHYEMAVPDGSFTVEQFIPNTHIWNMVCPSPQFSQYVAGINGGGIAQVDFAVNAEIICPELWVDIGAGNLRPYHTESYYVEYCNHGNDTSFNTYLDLSFDDLLSVQNSSIPWTSNNGNDYHYEIGTLLPGECGFFTLEVITNSLAGPTLCVEAAIGPVLNCIEPENPDWDHSSLSVTGNCFNDSLACFTITNTGSSSNGNMTGPSEIRIYENNILVYVGTIQLEGQQDTVICWPANGNEIQLQADQRPGHPGNSHPNDHVEACGTGGSSSSAWGYVNNMPLDDLDDYIAMDCQEVISSYDPNDKTAIPQGWGTLNYISAIDEIEYRIRFQNTGNDTAFLIVVRDTLTSFLDPLTVVSGVSSHEYQFKIYDNGILEWTFENILLPDSTTDEPGSHGFVKFKVKQIEGNLPGTLIENKVGIYFDFNPPVITNTTFNTVYEGQELNSIQHIEYQSIEVKVYPNPADKWLMIELLDTEDKTRQFDMIDATGRIVLHQEMNVNNMAIQINDYPAGFYIYHISEGGKPVSSGKIIIE